jgi:hypothetical protein
MLQQIDRILPPWNGQFKNARLFTVPVGAFASTHVNKGSEISQPLLQLRIMHKLERKLGFLVQ